MHRDSPTLLELVSFDQKRGQIKRSEKQSSCTYRGGCVVHEWLQAVIGRYYRGGRPPVVDQDI